MPLPDSQQLPSIRSQLPEHFSNDTHSHSHEAPRRPDDDGSSHARRFSRFPVSPPLTPTTPGGEARSTTAASAAGAHAGTTASASAIAAHGATSWHDRSSARTLPPLQASSDRTDPRYGGTPTPPNAFRGEHRAHKPPHSDDPPPGGHSGGLSSADAHRYHKQYHNAPPPSGSASGGYLPDYDSQYALPPPQGGSSQHHAQQQSVDWNWESPGGPSSYGSRKRRGNLPKEATMILNDWFCQHINYPYPKDEEKQQLQVATGLTLAQVNNWFINARRRRERPPVS